MNGFQILKRPEKEVVQNIVVEQVTGRAVLQANATTCNGTVTVPKKEGYVISEVLPYTDSVHFGVYGTSSITEQTNNYNYVFVCMKYKTSNITTSTMGTIYCTIIYKREE